MENKIKEILRPYVQGYMESDGIEMEEELNILLSALQQELIKMLPPEADMRCLKNREKQLQIDGYNDQFLAVFNRIHKCLSDMHSKIERMA